MKKVLLAATLLFALILFSSFLFAAGDTPCQSSGLITSSQLVANAGHQLCSVLIITDGTNAATAIVYDGTSASGTVLFKGTVSGTGNFGGGDAGGPIMGYSGIYVSLSGSGSPAVIVYFR